MLIKIRADYELVHLAAVVTSRHGIVKIQQIYCNYAMSCKFKLKITKDMIPEAKVVVYYMKNVQQVIQGETVIKIKEDNWKKVSIDFIYDLSGLLN